MVEADSDDDREAIVLSDRGRGSTPVRNDTRESGGRDGGERGKGSGTDRRDWVGDGADRGAREGKSGREGDGAQCEGEGEGGGLGRGGDRGRGGEEAYGGEGQEEAQEGGERVEDGGRREREGEVERGDEAVTAFRRVATFRPSQNKNAVTRFWTRQVVLSVHHEDCRDHFGMLFILFLKFCGCTSAVDETISEPLFTFPLSVQNASLSFNMLYLFLVTHTHAPLEHLKYHQLAKHRASPHNPAHPPPHTLTPPPPALERTYLSYFRISLGLAILGVVIAQLFRLQNQISKTPSSPTSPSNPSHPAFGFFRLGIPLAAICHGTAMLVAVIGGVSLRYFLICD